MFKLISEVYTKAEPLIKMEPIDQPVIKAEPQDDLSAMCFEDLEVPKAHSKVFFQNLHQNLQIQSVGSLAQVRQATPTTKCDLCGKSFVRGTKHDCAKTCKFCGKELAFKTQLYDHLKRVHPEKFESLIHCKLCPLKFFKVEFYLLHMERKHKQHVQSSSPETYKCQLDGKVFSSKIHLSQHMLQHLPTFGSELPETQASKCRVYTCEICRKAFVMKGQLNHHRRRVHLMDVKNFKCGFCGQAFYHKCQLEKHQLLHEVGQVPVKLFKCSKCSFSVSIKSVLQAHEQVHRRQEAMKRACDIV